MNQKYKYFPRATFIWNGTQADPQLKYKGKLYNYYVIEDSMYDSFKEYIEDNNLKDNDKNFEKYCKENSELFVEYFENY